MNFWIILFWNVALVFALIAVHEVGHYVAGLTAGIPASAMRVRLLTFPQHVAIRDGGAWLAPTENFPRYIELTRAYLATRGAAFRWVAGGVVLEAAFTTVVCLSAVQLGWKSLAFWTAAMSLGMYVINVFLMDLPWALLHRHPFGDTSGLLAIAKGPGVALTVFMLLLRIGILSYAIMGL